MKDGSAQRKNRPDGQYRFGVCTDGSLKSLEIFDFLARIMRPGDHLAVITVSNENVNSDKVKAAVEHGISKHGFVSLYYFLNKV
jgi:hypothetical protein